MYMHVYACTCAYMCEYASICVYLHGYGCIWVYMALCGCICAVVELTVPCAGGRLSPVCASVNQWCLASACNRKNCTSAVWVEKCECIQQTQVRTLALRALIE